MIGVYCIENVVTCRRYVGASMNLDSRIQSQMSAINRRSQHEDVNRLLREDFLKYRPRDFSVFYLEILPDGTTREELQNAEFYWMDKLNTTDPECGYNLRRDFNGRMIIHDTTRELYRLRTGEKNPNFGNRWTDEAKQKMSSNKKALHADPNGPYNDNWRQLIGKNSSQWLKDESKKAAMAAKVSKAKEKYIFHQYTRNGDFIRTWQSVKEIIAANPDWKWQNIYAATNGHKNHYRGYKWIREPKK